MKKPSLIIGGFIGAIITIPFIAVLYVFDQAVGLPFVPLDVFSFVRDVLPGDVLTIGIDAMVDTIISLDIGSVDSTAKSLEQLSGLLMVVGVGVVTGIIIIRLLNNADETQYMFLGGGVGFIVGVMMALIVDAKNFTATTEPIISFIWVVMTFTLWGMVFVIVYRGISKVDSVEEIEGRREFLIQIGSTAAVMTVVGTGLGTLLKNSVSDTATITTPIPESTLEANVAQGVSETTIGNFIPATGTRLEYPPLDDHYRIDISARPPTINGDEWRLNVSGLVSESIEVSLDELRNNYEAIDEIITISCISNRVGGDLIGTTRWTGVSLQSLLDDWNLDDTATHLKITGADNFFEYVDIEVIRNDPRVMLAYAWDGVPLKEKHGFPLRIYIPNRYGMKQPKWITDIEVVGEWDEGYWVRRGWSKEAIVRHTSVIDTVAVEDVYEQNDMIYVPIGGIAWAGARGISRVEVSIDDGEWVEAEIKEPLSELSWVIWRYDWPFIEGKHEFRVRCFDGEGTLQIEQKEGVRPDGATGYHDVDKEIELQENL